MMNRNDPQDEGWHIRLVQSRLPWTAGHPARPADVSEGLCDAMLARENILEDVNYLKVVPNRYIVELSEANFAANYGPIVRRVVQQWSEKLMECLTTANTRQGRKTYYFGGRVQIEIRPAPDLQAGQARIRCRIQPEEGDATTPRPGAPPCLELAAGGRRFPLHPGTVTLGRNQQNDIRLDWPEIQERRLVSSRHAYLRVEGRQARLFDGSLEGKPSVNGTYVNGERVPPEGRLLQHGDQVILAALDPQHPQADIPGVAVFRFWLNCA